MAVATTDPRALEATTEVARSGAARRGPIAERLVVAAASLVVAVVAAFALVPGAIAPGDPTETDAGAVLLPPGEGGLLGTDQYGRSIAALIVHGARVALAIGLLSVALAVVVGGLLGLVAGYFGGTTDTLISRVLDVMMCFPGILLALVIAAALGSSVRNLVLAVAAAFVPVFARVLRGQVMAVRGRLFVTAARSVGIRSRRILWRHVLPNAMAPVVVLATVSVGTSVVLAASLSFIGVGPRTTVPDWGQLLSTGQPYLGRAWWISTFPGVVITLTVIAISLLGDRLRDWLEAE